MKKQGHRCAAILENGKACGRVKDVKPDNYYGTGEYNPHTGSDGLWVKVYLCPKHRGAE